ncbi:MAG: small subunit ribosomal protein S16 [Lysobacterales bacterium]|jgi:small subunit ribosomal protein S16
MEVRIRLQRAGNKSTRNRYNYRIVAMSKTQARDSRHLEIIGHYDAAKKPAIVKIDQEKLDKWMANGAQMSETVKNLVKLVNKETSAA